jgi:glycosyltransferase involved in cell wall biosynthesis
MQGGGEPLVSVVTPFFNSEKYLAECIESVLGQTYEKWEYILVNNCSTDRSPDIARQYAEMDRRIRFIDNVRFMTQVENYNHALRQIAPEGKYCKIVQADDWIFASCLDEMVRVAESAPNVSLVGSYSLYDPLAGYGDRPYLGHGGLPYSCRVMAGRHTLQRYLAEYLCLFGSPTCVLYRTSDILAPPDFFHLGSPVEDIEACFEVLQKGDFGFVHQVLTFNRRQEGSFWWNMTKFHADELNKVILTHRYGPTLFGPAEYGHVLRRAKSAHYRCLGRALLEGRPAAFWQYHAQGLATVGQRIQKLPLLGYVLWAVLDILGNPKATLGHLMRARVRSPR